MGTNAGGFGTPGQGDLASTSEREIIWGGDDTKGLIMRRNGLISGVTRDAGNSPTSVLRAGLILGRITASGAYTQFDISATDGSQYPAAILAIEALATDFGGSNADRVFGVITRAPVRAAMLLIKGSSLVGHADEYLVRRALADAGFVFDDDPMGYLAGRGERVYQATGTAETLTASQNGSLVVASNAAAETITLPAIKVGLSFDILRTGDQNLIVTSPEGDNIIVGNDLSADSVTFSTAGQRIGARLRMRCIYVNVSGTMTPKWLCETVLPPFGTGTTGAFAYAIAT